MNRNSSYTLCVQKSRHRHSKTMRLSTLRIHSLRNHKETETDFSPDINLIIGNNGAGKTTILEAISIVSLSKSFLPTPDALLIHHEEKEYSVHAKAFTDLNVPYAVTVSYSAGGRKYISSSIGDSLSPKDIIGEMPIVTLSPDYKAITFGAPDDRRRFLDALLSQCSKRYVEEAIALKRIIKQRNDMLNSGKKTGYLDTGMLDVWTEAFIHSATEITARRLQFIEEFMPYFTEAYVKVSNGKEHVSLRYEAKSLMQKNVNAQTSKQEIAAMFHDIAKKNQAEEIRRGTTLFGPQKDDLFIGIHNGEARDYASQGQHKSLLIALKYAEFQYLYAQKQEKPILLYDDIFSELDEMRTRNVLHTVIETGAQVFITATEAHHGMKGLPEFINKKTFVVENGCVKI